MHRPDFGELQGLLQELTGGIIGPQGIGRLANTFADMQRFVEVLEARLEDQAAASKFSPDQRVWYTPVASKGRMQPMPGLVVANAGARVRVRLPAKSGSGNRVCQVSPGALHWVESENEWAGKARSISFP